MSYSQYYIDTHNLNINNNNNNNFVGECKRCKRERLYLLNLQSICILKRTDGQMDRRADERMDGSLKWLF